MAQSEKHRPSPSSRRPLVSWYSRALALFVTMDGRIGAGDHDVEATMLDAMM